MNDMKTKTASKNANKSTNTNAKSPRKSQEEIIRNNLYSVTIEKTFNYEIVTVGKVGKDTVELFGWDLQDFFRVLKGFNEKTYEFWLNHHTSPQLILDVDDISCQVKHFSDCDCDLLVIDKKVAKRIWDRRNLLIYYNGALWDYYARIRGTPTWKIMPIDPNYQFRIDAEKKLA
jgi:hypothetical protein